MEFEIKVPRGGAEEGPLDLNWTYGLPTKHPREREAIPYLGQYPMDLKACWR